MRRIVQNSSKEDWFDIPDFVEEFRAAQEEARGR
jgi:hypothetical protein